MITLPDNDSPLIVNPASSAGGNGSSLGYWGMDGFALYAALRANSAKGIGAKLASWPYDPRTIVNGADVAMVTGRQILMPQIVKGGVPIIGVAFVIVQPGVYTAVSSNQTAAYTYDGSNMHRVANSLSDGTLWKGAAGETLASFITPYTPPADMVLWASGLYNASAATTLPHILSHNIEQGDASNLFLEFLPTPGYALSSAVVGAANTAATIPNASINTVVTNQYWLAFAQNW